MSISSPHSRIHHRQHVKQPRPLSERLLVDTFRRLNPNKRLWLDYALAYLTTCGIIVTGVLTYRLASQNFDETGLSQYALLRRLITFIHPLLAVGLSVTLSRKVAACRFDTRDITESAYLLGGLVIALITSLTFSIVVLLFPEPVAYVFFGSSEYYRYALCLSPMLLGLCLHTVCYSHLHGRLSMRWANAVQFVGTGLIPLIVVVWPASITTTFVWAGIALITMSLAGIYGQLRNANGDVRGFSHAISDLCRFGPRRVPGDFAYAALMMLPAIIVTHCCGVKLGGLVAFSVTLLVLAQTSALPVSTLLLPQATAMLRSGRVHDLRTIIIVILVAAIGITLAGTTAFYAAVDVVLRVCLGAYAPELPGIAKIVMLGATPLNCHTCLRSVIDAGNDKAVNARSSCLALVAFFVALLVARNFAADLYAAPIALVFALSCLACLSTREAWQVLKPTLKVADISQEDSHALRRAA